MWKELHRNITVKKEILRFISAVTSLTEILSKNTKGLGYASTRVKAYKKVNPNQNNKQACGIQLNEQVGACGIHCGFCPVFRLQQNRCLGCEWVNQQSRKYGESHKGCHFWECTKEKKLECCFQCKEFPCGTHYDPERAVYTKQGLDNWRKLAKSGITFGKKRN